MTVAIDPLESRALLSTYYVSTGGSDSAAGTAAAPWKSLQKAANTVVAGDAVHVGAGTYTTGMNLYGKAGGTSAKPISFLADPGVTITHAATSGTNASLAGINIENAGDYYVIDGFNIQSDGSMQRAGIRVSGSDHVQVSNNTVNKAFIGIFASNADSLQLYSNTCSNSTDQHGIYVGAGTTNAVIRGNRMFGNNYDGLHLNASNSAGPNDAALVENNVMYNNNLSGIDAEGLTNAVIRNNVIYGNVRHGITIHSQDQTDAGNPTSPAANNVIVNNTIATASDSSGYAIQIRASDMKETIYNNVLIATGSYGGAMSFASDSKASVNTSLVKSDYNVVVDRFSKDAGNTRVSLATWRSQTGLEQHSVVSDASHVFVNASSGNYQLSSTSPAIDVGSSSFNGYTAPTTDMTGGARPKGAALDAGAYESGSSSTTDTTPPVISAVASSNLQSTAASIAWTTNEAATGQVEYGTSTAYGSSTTLVTTRTTSHTASLADLKPSTVYHFRVKSTDAAGNAAVSGDFTFTTPAAPDTTAPVVSNVATSGVSSTAATVNWSTNEASTTQVDFGATTSYGSSTTLNSSLVLNHSAVLSGLTAGTVYHYRVRSSDAAGNTVVSPDFTFTTAAAPDRTPPSVSKVTFDPRGGQRVSVLFSEDVGASLSASDFSLTNTQTGTSVSLVLQSVSADGKTAVLSFSNTGGVLPSGATTSTVLANGSYTFTVRAGRVADAASNALSTSSTTSFAFKNGDANVDGSVNFDDLLIVSKSYGATSNASFGVGDLNYDSKVNFDDLLVLAKNYEAVTVAAVDSFVTSAAPASSDLLQRPTNQLASSTFGVNPIA